MYSLIQQPTQATYMTFPSPKKFPWAHLQSIAPPQNILQYHLQKADLIKNDQGRYCFAHSLIATLLWIRWVR